MFELHGKYNNAKVFTDNVDDVTIGQIITMLSEPITKNTQVRIMPDTHYGKGATIGTSIKLPENRNEWKIAPEIVGVDLSCAMMSYKIAEKNIDLYKLDEVVNLVVPAGKLHHARPQLAKVTRKLLKQLSYKTTKQEKHTKALGTLGGGNHFIELAKDEDGFYWLTVHSGSRSLGMDIAKHHTKIAQKYIVTKEIKLKQKELIEKLKKENRTKEIETQLTELKKEQFDNKVLIPYLEGDLLKDYLNDIKIADQYAHLSRKLMLDNIVKEMGWEVIFEFDSVHNNIDQENGIIRKGATSANKDELLIIPLNMRDGSLICIGKGNEDWNNSAPHGAGRVLSRSQAKEVLDLEEYKEQMKNVFTSSVGESTLDEAPNVYKPAEEIKSLIGDTVDIIHHIKPVYNFKAH